MKRTKIQRPQTKKPELPALEWTSAKDQVARLGPAKKTRSGLLHFIDMARQTTGCGANLKVLEIGGGSGRLADFLIRTEQINPANYVLSDKSYNDKRAWALKKKVFLARQQGKMKVMPLDAWKRPPQSIGRGFHLIIMANVSGSVRTLESLIRNYFRKLAPGGIIVINRASDSLMGLMSPSSLFKSEQAHAIKLKQQLERLKAARQVEFRGFADLFLECGSKSVLMKDVFVLQRIKNKEH